MADTKISGLTGIASGVLADGDKIAVADASDLTASYSATMSNVATYITAELFSGLTGVIRSDAGTLSVDADVTDIVAASSDSAAGKIEIAIQSEMETGTDVVRAVTPGRQQFHLSAAKCWVASTQSSTTIQQSFNIASVADTGAGISTVTIAADFSGTTYCVVVGAEHNSASATTQTYNIDNGGRAAGSYVIQSWQVDGTEVLTDPSASWFSVAFGDQV